MPTLAEKWIEEGKKEGLQQGMERGLQQGIERGLQQGIERGEKQGIINSIVELLMLRFDAAPTIVSERLSAVEELETLKLILRHPALADSLSTFEKYLNTL